MTASHHPAVRFLAFLLTGVLFLSSGPVLLAQSARSVMSPAGGGSGGGGRGSAANLNNAGAASAALTATRAREALQKSEASLNAMKTLQVNARNLMARSETDNGLKNGWLEPHVAGGGSGIAEDGTPDTSSWAGARITSAKDSASVVIKQSLQSAFLYWNKFNVGSKTTIRFDQSAGGNDAGKWIAFNKVMGSVDPSRIYGSINAEGQVYILNQNGIIFHNGSQVNTHALVASTLPINENLAGSATKAGRGIANNPDSQFLFSALTVPGNLNKNTDGFTPNVTGPIGDVIVERGASIISPVNANNTGGLVALVGANIRNEGTISTPNGQTILASGLQVGLTPHNSADASLRGMDVTVGRVTDPDNAVTTVSESGAGSTRNDGVISVFRGNATLAGRDIQLNGGIESSTSVDLNGRIDLLASYNAVPNSQFGLIGDALIRDYNQPNSGNVEMGRGSVLRILPEWESSRTIPSAALALPSLVTLSGRNIAMNEGAILLAPGATASSGALSQTGAELKDGVTLQAGRWTDKGGNKSVFTRDVGRIDIGRNATINAAGSTAAQVRVDIARNFLKLQLRGAELADSPLQRKDENIRGVDLVIDSTIRGTYQGRSWIGTPLGDVSGFVGLIDRTAGELTTAGGSVSLLAGDAVSTAPGSSVDVSGGSIRYSGGYVSTSKLLYQGHLLDISQATPDRVYEKILTAGDRTILGKTFNDVGASATIEQSSKWGQVKVYESILDPTSPIWRPSQVSGASGGSLSINAPSVALDGELHGNTVAGPTQIRDHGFLPGMNQAVLSTLPAPASFSLDLSRETGVAGILLSPYAPRVTFSSQPFRGGGVPLQINESGVANSLPQDRKDSVILSRDLLSAHGFGKFSVSSRDGDIVLPSGVVLDAGPNGSVALQSANVWISGGIQAPGGTVSLQAFLTPLSLANVNLPEILPASVSGIMTLREDEGILRRGEKVIALGDPAVGPVTVYRANGTEVSVSGDHLAPLSAGRVSIGEGARINVAGLVANDLRDANTKPIVLNGGSVSISGYHVSLAPGSFVDVSAGFRQSHLGGIAGSASGDAGSITIAGGQDNVFPTIHRGSLDLRGTLAGYAGVGSFGGSLSLKAPAFRISRDGIQGDDRRVTPISSTFFNQGGFSSFSLSGIGLETKESDVFVPGVSVESGTVIRPRVMAQMFNQSGKSLYLPGGGLASAPSLTLAATGLRDESLDLKEKLLIRGAVEVGAGSSIILNPQIILSESFPNYRAGSLDIHAPVISFAGSASVPGGSITISGNSRYQLNGERAADPGDRVTLDLAPTASLSVAGTSLYSRDPLRIRPQYGTLLSGGSVSLSGNILTRSGSVIDASGASGTFDLLPYQAGVGIEKKGARELLSSGVVSRQLDSAGGSISLVGQEALRSEATLAARSGGKTASGGNLSISSGRYYVQSTDEQPTDLGLVISQSGNVVSKGFALANQSAIGLDFENLEGIASGGGHVAVSSFASGGFQNLTLGGNVLFRGPVSISVPGLMKVATKGILSADSRTELTATAVTLGTPFLAPFAPNDPRRTAALDPNKPDIFAPPTWGVGELVVRASRIDLGNLSLQGIGKAGFHAQGGSIRGNGNLVMAGDLTLQAGIIYPASGTDFRAVAFNHEVDGSAVSEGGSKGSITVLAGGVVPLPLSALGSISLQADTILQSGTLAAPLGSITLGRTTMEEGMPDPLSGLKAPVASRVVLTAGSLTTVSAIDRQTGLAITVPYGISVDGTSWTAPSEKANPNDPAGTDITGTGLSGKLVAVGGNEIIMQPGAVLDIRGGGEVTARQWVSGLGGTRDILNDNSGSWAIVPGYGSPFTPKGYGEEMVAEGTRIVLKQGALGLAPGTYTLLPASYATQPGAYLLSRSSMHGVGSAFVKPDGTAVVPGTLVAGLDSSVQTPEITSLFELLSPRLIALKSEYRILKANTFFSGIPASGRTADGGRLQIFADSVMNLSGSVATAAASGGRAGMIDIASAAPILVTGSSGPWETPAEGTIQLDATALNAWDAGSILIGGYRTPTASGAQKLTPTTTSVTVDTGTSLTAREIILAAAPKTYTVVEDDTPESVAETLGGDVTVGDLLAANQLASDATLTAGQILKVPGSPG